MTAEKPTEKLLNITDLEFRFGIHRNTVRQKLRLAGIQPVAGHGRDKKYRLSEVEEILSEATAGLDELKIRKLAAEAEEKELKVQERKGELVSAAEVKAQLQQIFTKLHREIAVTMPKKVSARIRKAKDAPTVTAILQKEVGAIFERLRNDHTEFLDGSDQ